MSTTTPTTLRALPLWMTASAGGLLVLAAALWGLWPDGQERVSIRGPGGALRGGSRGGHGPSVLPAPGDGQGAPMAPEGLENRNRRRP